MSDFNPATDVLNADGTVQRGPVHVPCPRCAKLGLDDCTLLRPRRSEEED